MQSFQWKKGGGDLHYRHILEQKSEQQCKFQPTFLCETDKPRSSSTVWNRILLPPATLQEVAWSRIAMQAIGNLCRSQVLRVAYQ